MLHDTFPAPENPVIDSMILYPTYIVDVKDNPISEQFYELQRAVNHHYPPQMSPIINVILPYKCKGRFLKEYEGKVQNQLIIEEEVNAVKYIRYDNELGTIDIFFA